MREAQITEILEKVFAEIISEAKTNPRFASRLLRAVQEVAGESDVKRSHRRSPAALDPFALYSESQEALRRQLEKLSLEQLKDIVAEHGMDRSKLVMKWKTPVRIIDLIVQTVAARARKGDAFRGDASPRPRRENAAMVTDEDVVDSKFEDIIRGQGRRLNVRCMGQDGGRYVLEAWIGDPERPSGRPKSGAVERKDLDETSTSGLLKPQVDAVISRFCQALGAIPDDPRDREMFPVFVDGIKGEALAGLLRDIVARLPNGATAEAVAREVVGKTGSRSDLGDVVERVGNILDHLTLRSRLGLEYRDGRYRIR